MGEFVFGVGFLFIDNFFVDFSIMEWNFLGWG